MGLGVVEGPRPGQSRQQCKSLPSMLDKTAGSSLYEVWRGVGIFTFIPSGTEDVIDQCRFDMTYT